MATSRPSVTPVITPLYLRQLELTILLNLYQALHGGDPFSGDRVGAEALALGLVSHLDQNTGVSDKIVENLTKMRMKLKVTIDGKTTEVHSTKQYRELMEQDQPGPLKTVIHCIFPPDIEGSYCWKTVLQVKDNQN
jgi:hypothetical protein